MKEYQSHIIAAGGTIVLLLLLFLLLFKLTIEAPIQLEDEGIIITFGDADEGGGTPDVLPMPDPITQVEQQPAAPMPTPAQPSENDLMVQEDEESLALAQQNEDDLKRQAEEEEMIRKQKEEEARLEAERIAREKALAEQKAREEEAIKKAQAMAALFGQAGSTEGANAENATATPAATSKGDSMGENYGESNGVQWKLDGRRLRQPLLKPSKDFIQDGVVIVQIWVDQSGNVTNAVPLGGTTISDLRTQQLALNAARQAKFTEGKTPQIGIITYEFSYTIE